jgi:hypothetical protein
MKGVESQQVYGRGRSGQKNPLRRGTAKAMSILIQHLRRVVLRVDRDGDQPHIRFAAYTLFQSVHLRRHARARPRAVRVDEIDHPDLSIERLAVECSACRVGHPECGDMAVTRKLGSGAVASSKTCNRGSQSNGKCFRPPAHSRIGSKTMRQYRNGKYTTEASKTLRARSRVRSSDMRIPEYTNSSPNATAPAT